MKRCGWLQQMKAWAVLTILLTCVMSLVYAPMSVFAEESEGYGDESEVSVSPLEPVMNDLQALDDGVVTLYAGVPVDATLDYYTNWVGVFTAPSTGYYLFSSAGEYYSSGSLYADEGLTQELEPFIDESGIDRFWFVRKLSAGETVFLDVGISSYVDDPVTITVSVEQFEMPDMVIGEFYDVSLQQGETWWGAFTAPEDGAYWISLRSDDEIEREIRISSSWHLLNGKGQVGRVELEAGETIDIKMCGEDESPADFSICIARGFDLALLECSYSDTSFIADGRPHAPAIGFPYGPTTMFIEHSLVEDVDFVVSYVDEDGNSSAEAPTKAGSYQAVCTGSGGNVGSVSVPFEIVEPEPAKIADFDVTYSEELTSDDWYDYYKLDVSSGGRVKVSGSASYAKANYYLYDPNGRVLWSDHYYSDKDFSTLYRPGFLVTKGTYYFAIELEDGEGPYDITFSFTDVEESFPEEQGGSNNTAETASAISPNVEYKGSVAFGDLIDFYRFTMPSDARVTLKTAIAPGLVLKYTIHDSSQVEVWSKVTYNMSLTGDHEFTEEIDLPAGDYYLEIRFAPMEKRSYGLYSFSLECDLPQPTFKDVNERTPHSADITWLASSGISTGWKMTDGTVEFRPANTVIRQDMAAFLFRLAKLWGIVDDSWQPTGSVTFKDVSPATPHYREIMWLAESGISSGWKVGNVREFRPTNTVIRQDMAAFLRRLQALRDPSVRDWKPTDASPFRDVTASTPHSEDILWLAESGVSAGWKVGGSKEFRPTNTVIRQDMAAFLHRLDGLG